MGDRSLTYQRLPPEQLLRVENLCGRFENEWRAGGRPRVEDFLVAADAPEYRALLHELILVDTHYRSEAGETPGAADYAGRFAGVDAAWVGAIFRPAALLVMLCSKCQRKIGIPENALGKAIRCPLCKAVIQAEIAPVTVPAASDAVVTAAAKVEADPASPGDRPTVTYGPGETVPPRYEAPASGSQALPTFPGYEILGLLGRGGMGVVYKARDVKLKRIVALKVILSGDHAGGDELARFKAEAEAIARLKHPNIVQIYEVGEHDGKPFLSLEFCAGGSLEKKLGGTPLPPEQAAQLMQTLARAMHAVHQAQVIHRDLKPANVLLETSDSQTQNEALPNSPENLNLQYAIPKITDFGLAKKLDDLGQTQSGAIMGTPSYMAPEQADGKSKESGPSTDVYALGAILYELLTGRPPFKAATPVETIMQVASDEPVPPKKLQSRTPQDLDTICLKCLRKVPAERYASAAELADDLERYGRGEPVLARPVGQIQRALKWARRNKRLIAAGLAVPEIALVLGIALAGWKLVTAYVNDREEAEVTLYIQNLNDARRKTDQGLNYGAAALAYLEKCPISQRNWEFRYLLFLSSGKKNLIFEEKSSVSSVCFSPDSQRLAYVGPRAGMSMITIRDLKSGLQVLNLQFPTVVHFTRIRIRFSPDGKHLAAADGVAVKIWDVQQGQEIFSTQQLAFVKGQLASDVCFSADSQRLTEGGNGTFKVWDIAKRQEVLTFKTIGNGGLFSPDGSCIVTEDIDVKIPESEKVYVLNANNGQKIYTLHGAGGVQSFSPDGKLIATTGTNGTLKIWAVADGQEVQWIKGPSAWRTAPQRSFCFSPDGKRIAFGAVGAGDAFGVGFNGEVNVWHMAKDREVLSLKSRLGVNNVCFSPDGQYLAVGREYSLEVMGLEDPRATTTRETLKAGDVVFVTDTESHVALIFLYVLCVALGVLVVFRHPMTKNKNRIAKSVLGLLVGLGICALLFAGLELLRWAGHISL